MTRRTFALVGDTHADATSRFEEHNAVMKHIAWDAKGRGAQALLHSGDLYERASNSLEREAVASWVMTAASLMQVVIIRGNHDDPRDVEAIGHLRTEYPVHVDTRPGPLIPLHTYTAGGAYTDEVLAWIAVLPWPEKTHLLAGREQKSRAQGDADAVTALRNILRDYGDRFAALENDTSPRIFLGHCMMRGSSVGISQPPLVGADFELGLDDLALAGADFYGLGHIHLGQEWTVADDSGFNEARVIYPGSPFSKNFGETEEKSYVLVTFDDREVVSVERIPTPCRKMIHLTGGYGIVDGLPECFLDAAPPEMDNAEVRLRYEVKPEERVAARAAAQTMASVLRAQGAANVVIEEVVQVEQRARAPEVAAATNNADRLRAHWASKSLGLAREGELIAKLGSLEESLAETSQAPRLGAIRFRRLAIKGFGPFAAERDVSFDQLDGKLTAVTGTNGAGKSTLLELLLGGVYRRCPTRGDLVNLATARDACLEVECDTGGHHYYVKQLVDAVSRKSEAVITRDTFPAVRSTKVTAVQEYVERNFPSLDLQLVSTFAAQGSRGFLDTKPSERKALLLQVRGVEHIQELAGLARLRVIDESDELSKLSARITDRELQAQGLDDVRAELGADETSLLLDEEGVRQANEAIYAAVEQNAQRSAVAAGRTAHQARASQLDADRRKATEDLRVIRARLQVWESIKDRAAVIRAAVARAAELTPHRAQLQEAQRAADAQASALAQRRRQLTEAQQRAQRMGTDAGAALERKSTIDECILRRPIREAELTAAVENEERVRQALRAAEGQQLLDADGRIDALRGTLTLLRDGPPDRPPAIISDIAAGAIERDDATVARAIEVPKQILDLCGQLGTAERERRRLESHLAQINQVCAQLPLMERALQDQATATADLERLSAELHENTTARQNLPARETFTQQLYGIDRELAQLQAAAAEAPKLERAEAALEELNPQETKLVERAAALAAEHLALGEPPPAAMLIDVRELERERDFDDQAVKDRRAKIERRRERIASMEAAAGVVAQLRETHTGHLLELSDWQRLVNDLGKDGLQAALSDAALPELVALTNSLLHSAFGPRFTVDVRSQKGDAAGRRMLETLDVMVIDTGDVTRGIPAREALAETFSGGELAIIGEALSLALTVLACRSSDGTPPTLVRDEAGAALDPVNGRAWIAMLRRAVDMVGADRLLFVSHSPELTALADSRIEL